MKIYISNPVKTVYVYFIRPSENFHLSEGLDRQCITSVILYCNVHVIFGSFKYVILRGFETEKSWRNHIFYLVLKTTLKFHDSKEANRIQ